MPDKRKSSAHKSYLTVEDVAQKFNVNTTTIYRLIQQGKLPGFKIGGQWRFKEDMLDDWVADQVTLTWHRTENHEAT